jgi:hypothetical protein
MSNGQRMSITLVPLHHCQHDEEAGKEHSRGKKTFFGFDCFNQELFGHKINQGGGAKRQNNGDSMFRSVL